MQADENNKQTFYSPEFLDVLKAANIKQTKEPKKYKKTNEHELKLLHFIAHVCAEAGGFPINGRTWSTFKQQYAGPARARDIKLPSLASWNKVRKNRLYDVFNNLHDAQKWWTHSRKQNNLLATNPPPKASCADACKALLICPKKIPNLIKILRCHEIMTGLKVNKPADYHEGAHPCSKCHQYAIPKCFVSTSKACLSRDCMERKMTAELKKKRKREMKDKLAKYYKERNVKKHCSRCSCNIQCRQDEYKPRRNPHLNTLLIGVRVRVEG